MTGLKHFEDGCCYPAESYPAVYFNPRNSDPNNTLTIGFSKNQFMNLKNLQNDSPLQVKVTLQYYFIGTDWLMVVLKSLENHLGCVGLSQFLACVHSIFYIYPSVDIWYDELSYKKLNWWVCR